MKLVQEEEVVFSFDSLHVVQVHVLQCNAMQERIGRDWNDNDVRIEILKSMNESTNQCIGIYTSLLSTEIRVEIE